MLRVEDTEDGHIVGFGLFTGFVGLTTTKKSISPAMFFKCPDQFCYIPAFDFLHLICL